MINAKKSVSSYQISRDLGLRQGTAWSIQQRIRAAMAMDPEQKALFHGIVEADETYIGGKPRKRNRVKHREPGKRGLGTGKTPVIGVLERGGRVMAQKAEGKLTSDSLEQFIRRFVERDGTILITDQNPGYRQIGSKMAHAIINHSLAYVEQLTCLRAPHRQAHTNAIEGFWALVKRAWYGTHHHYSEKYMPLYIAEACWKYKQPGEQRGGFQGDARDVCQLIRSRRRLIIVSRAGQLVPMTKLHMLMLLSLLFAYLVYLQANEHYNAFFHGKPLDKKSSLVCSIAYGTVFF